MAPVAYLYWYNLHRVDSLSCSLIFVDLESKTLYLHMPQLSALFLVQSYYKLFFFPEGEQTLPFLYPLEMFKFPREV